MSDFFLDSHRELQDRFDTRRLADRLDQDLVHDAITESEKTFIESRMMFFIATSDERGHATCSYRGGDPGFVQVVGRADHDTRRRVISQQTYFQW